MSAVMEAGTQSATKKDVTGAIQLSDDELQQGARILETLQTVERGLRCEDTNDQRVIPMIAQNVVKNEQHKVVFSDYIRRTAGTNVLDQRQVVEQLLVVCLQRREARSNAG